MRPPHSDVLLNTFLRETELAERWRISVRTLQRWRQRGAAPRHVRFGRRVLYRMVDVLAHEASAAQAPAGPRAEVQP